jgi:serine/threonine-protein kinase
MRHDGSPSLEREQRLDDVLVACLEALDQGQPVQTSEWLARYPEFADELAGFFAGQEKVHRLAAPLRSALAAAATPPADRTPPPGAPDTGDAAGLPASLGDYELQEEIGAGGMGVVYKARQRSLGRLVALKMIRGDHAAYPTEGRRFRNEAEMAAGLDHPHIVPVHEVAEHAGQLYFSMKLIEGGSLAARIGQFRSDPRGAARLVATVARAVHYAHQRGILHRDLKPGNILLDAAGKPHVTDFGLARRVESDSSLTQSGALVGTPAYMAPEQASGQKGAVTTAADVYGLGALLYALLTGGPPFRGETVADTLLLVRASEPVPPSRANPLVDRNLETICLKCLDKEPERRYASAEALAEDLERWLADEPIRARPIGRLARSWRWCRRNRRLAVLAAAAAIAVVFGVAALGGSIGWVAHEQAMRRKGTEQVVSAALHESLVWQGRGNVPEALSAARQAAGVVTGGTADEDLRGHVRARLDDLELLEKLENARLEGTAIKAGNFDTERTDRMYRDVFTKAGLDVEALSPEEAGKRIRATTVAPEIAAALDDWALTRSRRKALPEASWKHLLAVAREADPEAARTRLRDALLQSDRQALLDLANDQAIRLGPTTRITLADALARIGASAQAEAHLRETLRRHPDDFFANSNLAASLVTSQPPRLEEAIRYFTAAAALRPRSPGAHYNLGTFLAQRGDLERAAAALRHSIDLKEDYAQAHTNLGLVLRHQGDLNGAIAEYHKALHIDPDLIQAHVNLGEAFRLANRPDEAITACRKALRIKDVAEAHYTLGDVFRNKGQLDEAIAEFRKAIDLKTDSAVAHNHLGGALQAKGQLDEAIAEYREAIRFQKAFPEAYVNLGGALQLNGDPDGAIAACREAIFLSEDLAEAHCNLGLALRRKGQFQEALKELRRGHDLGLRKASGWPYPSAQWIQECERLIELNGKLPAILNGEEQAADAAEWIALAELCQLPCKKCYAAAARLYGEAFAAEPQRAGDRPSAARYNAACAAALAGCGQGQDAYLLDPGTRARLRQQALAWLRADLAAWHKALVGDRSEAVPAVRQEMQHWLEDVDFAGVRGPAALAKLPDAERALWQKLWAEVEALFVQAGGKTAGLEN